VHSSNLVDSVPVLPDPTDLRNLAERYTAAWCSQNPESVAAFYSDQGSLRVNDGAPAVGRDASAEVAQSFMTAFPDLCVVMDDLRVKAANPSITELSSARTAVREGRGKGSALAALSNGGSEVTA